MPQRPDPIALHAKSARFHTRLAPPCGAPSRWHLSQGQRRKITNPMKLHIPREGRRGLYLIKITPHLLECQTTRKPKPTSVLERSGATKLSDLFIHPSNVYWVPGHMRHYSQPSAAFPGSLTGPSMESRAVGIPACTQNTLHHSVGLRQATNSSWKDSCFLGKFSTVILT